MTDEEANRDLSLEIVEKARKREDKIKKEVSSTESVRKNVRSDRVIDSSCLSSSDEAEDVDDHNFGVMEKATKRGTKRNRKEDSRVANRKSFRLDTVSDLSLVNPSINSEVAAKTKLRKEEEKVIENDQKFAINVENLATAEAPDMDPVEMFNNDMMAEESLRTVVEDVNVEGPLETTEPLILEAIGTSDNVVLQKLLGQDCYICKRRGHIAKNFPEKHHEDFQNSKICLQCSNLGDDMLSCGNDYPLEDLKEIQCYICKRFGHLCCANIHDYGPREVSCYNCGQSDHTGLGCAKTNCNTSSAASPPYCYKCGEEGHIARGCNKSGKFGRWVCEPSTPTQRLSMAHKRLGFRSIPPDIGEIHKKTTPMGERQFKTIWKSKRKGGRITDDQGDVPNTKGKAKGWTSFSSTRKGRTAAVCLSRSQSPLRKHIESCPHVSPKTTQHRFSASRFGNNKGHFGRMHK